MSEVRKGMNRHATISAIWGHLPYMVRGKYGEIGTISPFTRIFSYCSRVREFRGSWSVLCIVSSMESGSFIERNTGGPAYGSAIPIADKDDKITVVRISLPSFLPWVRSFLPLTHLRAWSVDSRTWYDPLRHLPTQARGPHCRKCFAILVDEKVRSLPHLRTPYLCDLILTSV